MDVNLACVAYLKTKPGALRFMKLLRDKYKSYGRLAGRLQLILNEDEAVFINGLMKSNYHHDELCRLSCQKFVDAFQETKFVGIVMEEVLNNYFDESIVSNKIHELSLIQQQEIFFDGVGKRLKSETIRHWLSDVLHMSPKQLICRFLEVRYRQSEEKLSEDLIALSEIERLLTQTNENENTISLPVLSALTTKDPHALDTDRSLYRLLIYYLSDRSSIPVPKETFDKQRLLSTYGIIVEVGNRHVLTYGLEAVFKGKELDWKAFFLRKEPLTLTMKNLTYVDSIVSLSSRGFTVCVENPAVFTALSELRPELSLVCTSGQLHFVDFKVLELIQGPWFYWGDYDPEGLLIADKLWRYFAGKMILLGYSIELYDHACSQAIIDEKRLKQLSRLVNEDLIRIGQKMTDKKLAGYQEYVIQEVLEMLDAIINEQKNN